MSIRSRFNSIFVCLVATTLAFFSSNLFADIEDLQEMSSGDVRLVKGELITLQAEKLTRLSITDPEVADIIDADESEILIIGRQIGQTILFVWDEQGKRDILISVVSRDPARIKERLKSLLEAGDIHELELEINDQEGKVVISGDLPEKKRVQFDKIVLPFSDEVVDLVNEENVEDLVQVDLQISELTTTLTRNLGIDWTTDSGGSAGGIDLNYDEDLPGFDGRPTDFFKIGHFARTNALKFKINALLEEGKGRILSQPKLVVVSGEEASFLVGGEIPIRTTTTSEGSSQENVEFKEYGISMTITPTIYRGNKIDVAMGLEVSDIDSANAVGDDVAFTTREADTRLIVDDGQTIIMAGLIKEQEGDQVRKVPFLGEVPVLGLLFRSRSMVTPDSDTELVIMLTPHIMRTSKESTAEEDRVVGSQGTIEKYASNAKPYYSGVPSEMRNYVAAIQEKISRSLSYPAEAAQYGWEGTVKVNMLILHDGTLAFALVRESSGFEIIDDHALEIAKANAPYSSFPPEASLQELNVTIPIVYSLNRF